MKYLVFVLVVLAGSSAAAAPSKCTLATANAAENPVRTLAAEQIREEIDCIVEILRNVHPNLYVYKSKRAFSKLAAAVRRDVRNDLSLERANSVYQRLLSEVCDEHTTVSLPPPAARRWPYRSHGLPVPLYVIGDKLYGKLPRNPTATTLDGSTQVLEIVAIADTSATEIRKFILSQIQLDACAANRPVHLASFPMQRKLTGFLGARSTYQIQARNRSGGLQTFDIRGRGAYKLRRRLAHEVIGTLAFPLDANGFAKVADADNWHYYRNDTSGIGYLYVHSFNDVPDAAVDRLMRTILTDNPPKLIVDLSNNPGGSIGTAMRMNSYLIPKSHRPADFVRVKRPAIYRPKDLVYDRSRKALEQDLGQFRRGRRVGDVRSLRWKTKGFGHPDYKGKLYVLVSHRTGSAATSSAFVLKRYRKNVTLIGSDTHGGGKWGCMTARGYYVLPHSQMRLYVPQYCLKREGQLADRFENAVLPDIRLEPRVETIDRFGIDLMALAIDHVAKD